MKFIILSENNIGILRKKLFNNKFKIFSVSGKYGFHFNALKYFQLLLEKAMGIRAGFKLDTDEGIKSEDLYHLKGKTWLQTLCHQYWGGNALDNHNNKVMLGVNVGEYINSDDIEQSGYDKAVRMSEVKIPKSFITHKITFFKDYAQGKVTKLYNDIFSLDEFISHPVVKGGGYGITNEALKKSAQFTLSKVGRAEDQQFYFAGLPANIRSIFHPDLRIAHYKSSVQISEKKQEATKFAGDMFRLIIFQHIVELLGIKYDIDPFPGIFCGKLARTQATLTLLLQTLFFSQSGNEDAANYLISVSVKELLNLKTDIDKGNVKKLFKKEKNEWKKFVNAIESLDKIIVKETIKDLIV